MRANKLQKSSLGKLNHKNEGKVTKARIWDEATRKGGFGKPGCVSTGSPDAVQANHI